MKTVVVTESSSVDDLLQQSDNEDVLVVRDGHAVALVVPFDDEDRRWYERERDPAFMESIARARQQVQQGQTTGHDQLKRDLGL
jgi:hypothetical protein